MRREGIAVIPRGIQDYSGKHDLILLLNPHFPSTLALRNLEDGGRIIANNYFGADAATPLIRAGLPILRRWDVRDGKVIELSEKDAREFECYFVFGNKR